MMERSLLWEECACQWCANLDATPCSAIDQLERRVEALEDAVRRLLPPVNEIRPQ